MTPSSFQSSFPNVYVIVLYRRYHLFHIEDIGR